MIIDLIQAIKDAYNKIYAEKIEAKSKIKIAKKLFNEWKDRANNIKLVENLLKDNWQFLPIKQRKDYIQKTVDLIHHGFDVEYHEDGSITYYGGYDFGLKNMYDRIVDIIKGNLKDMKDLYENHEYQKVIKAYDNCIDEINEKLVKYHILEIVKNLV